MNTKENFKERGGRRGWRELGRGLFPLLFLKKAGKNKSQKRVAGCNLESSALKADTIYGPR